VYRFFLAQNVRDQDTGCTIVIMHILCKHGFHKHDLSWPNSLRSIITA